MQCGASTTGNKACRTAVRPEYECPTKADQAVLWSNIVACHLQLASESSGDMAHAQAAVEDAKHWPRDIFDLLRFTLP
jgi:hypothetical protein